MISVRAKDVASFAKKILTKNYADPWVKITDKIGARVVVDEPGDSRRILDALPAAGIELVGPIDDKLLERPANELGYLGRHVQITTPALIDRRGLVVECELQVQTRARRRVGGCRAPPQVQGSRRAGPGHRTPHHAVGGVGGAL